MISKKYERFFPLLEGIFSVTIDFWQNLWFWELVSEKVKNCVIAFGWLSYIILWINIIVSLVTNWYAFNQFKSFMIRWVEYLYDLKPRIGLEHFIINTCSLDIKVLLLLIRMGAAYLMTLIIMEFVSIFLVLTLEYLNISLKVLVR